MKNVSILSATLVASFLTLAAPVQADPKPRPSQPLAAQAVANKFAGLMQVWKGCKGGVYFGGKWEAVSYCGQNKNSVGVGTWTVSKGRLCYELTWYFVKNGTLQTKVAPMKCEVEMVSDKDGQVWHSWLSDSDWWRGFPREKHFSRGNAYKRQVAKLRKQYGV